MDDVLDELPAQSRTYLVTEICRVLDVDEASAESLIRAAEPLWNALEEESDLVDSWGGGEFCAIYPRVLAFIRDAANP
ncbi:MAG: hypothetical protein KBB39_03655 [Phycicoccus sp.]|nr:hypothetical protein [Phycicoccus sp.]